ncbi:carboxypeptidase-like regulatory domain-containing protein [Microlunatus ginsengisoli]
MMLVLAACASPYGGTSSGDTPSGDTSNTDTSNTGRTNTGRTNTGGTNTGGTNTGGTSVVSGQITDRETGRPYPNAYVRFEWLVNATYANEIHTVTDGSGRYVVELQPGQYQVTAGDSCDLNAGFAIVGRAPDDVMISVPETSEVDFVEYPITPGADIPGVC